MDKDRKNVFLATLAAILLACLYLAAVKPVLSWEDSFDYAQLSRNLAEGRGFSSWRANVALLESYPAKGQASMVRAPLVPLMTAGLFRLFGTGDGVVMVQSLVFFALLAPLTYLLARRILGPGEALAAALLLISNRVALHYSYAGAAEFPFAFFSGLSLYFLLGSAPGLAGLAAGLAYLSRYDMIFFFPFLLFIAAQKSPRSWRNPGLFSAAFALAVLPWWIRNALVWDNPLYSFHNMVFAMYSDSFPSYSLYGAWVQGGPVQFVVGYLASHPAEFAAKTLRGLRSLSLHLPDLLDFPLGPLALAGFAFFAKGVRGRLAVPFLGMILTYFLILSCINVYWTDAQRYFIAFLPAFSVFAVAGWKRLTGGRRPLMWSLAAAVWLLSLAFRPAFPRTSLTDRATLSEISALTGASDLVSAAYPSQIAWAARRRTLVLPRDFETLEILKSRGLAPDFIFLNGALFLEEDPEDPRMGPLWADFKGAYLGGAAPPGYRQTARLRDGLLFARGG